MEKYPKTRTPAGTPVVLRWPDGEVFIANLQDFLDGEFPAAKVMAVSLTVGPLKSWIRAYKHHSRKSA